MFNLRFKLLAASSVPFVLRFIPKVEFMLRHPEKYSDDQRYEAALKIINFMKKRSRTKTLVYGKSNLPEDDNFILYSNHQGKYDALGILLAVEQPCSVLFEKRQAKRIVARHVCGLIDAVTLDLEDLKDQFYAIKSVIGKVNEGMNFLIFPEGGYKNNRNHLQEFHTGCFGCSLKSKKPIVPVAIYDSYKAMNSNSLRKVTTQVHFLEKIEYEEYCGMKKKELAELVKQRIQEKLDEIEYENEELQYENCI